MMDNSFEMVAKTFQGLEEVLAEELRALGAENVMPGRRMVAFEGDLEMLYRANLCCRTALRILKPFYKFRAGDADSLYDHVKEYDWSKILKVGQTFSIDTVTNSDSFKHSRFVTYRVKDAIADWFVDRYGEGQRPGIRLQDADAMINVHINGNDVTLSLDSSGESLHKRGYRVAQTEAPINEVLAAGILLRTGWRGGCTLLDPMCGSGTFLIEAALIAANINPGIYRKGFAFERWADYDAELFDRLYNDDSAEREVEFTIYGADISPKAIEIAGQNIKSAGVAKYIHLERKPLSAWTEAPDQAGVIVTNPPYGERISAPDMDALYAMLGTKLKKVFTGWHAWILGYRDEYFAKIGLAPSEKIDVLNGSLECSLREYIIFEGDRKSFVSNGGRIGKGEAQPDRKKSHDRDDRRPKFIDRDERRSGDRSDRRFDDRRRKFDDRDDRRFDDRRKKFGDRDDRRFDDRRKKFDDRSDRRFDDRRKKFDDRSDRRFDDRRKKYDDSRYSAPEPQVVEESENPLAKRRNPDALKMLHNKQPKMLPAQESGVRMRSRGWKKRDE